MKTNFIFYMCLLLLCSCKHKSSGLTQKIDDALYEISLDDAIEDNEFSFEKFKGSIRYVQLETTSESLITDIRFLGLLNDTIVVVDDARQIMSFSKDGKYIGRIGGYGGGPNEYSGIRSFSFDIDLGHAIVIDFGSRVLRYDLKGNLIASYNLNNEVIRTSEEDVSLFSNDYIFNYYQTSVRNPYAHSYYGINDSLKFEFINPNLMYKCESSIWSEFPITQAGDTVVFVKPLSDTIFQFTEGYIAPRFVFRHKEPSLSQSKIDFFNHSENELNYEDYLTEQQKRGYFVGIKNIFETKNFLLFSLNIKRIYIFDKLNQLLYHIKGFKDDESYDVFYLCKNSSRNSLIALMSASNAWENQENMLNEERSKEEEERLKNSPTEYERLILDFEEENNPIVIIATFEE